MNRASSPTRPRNYPGPSWQWNSGSSSSAGPNVLHRLLRTARRRRRLLAALLLCLAAAVAVGQLTPSSPATDQILVAVRDLPAGHALTSNDVRIAAVSRGMIPDGAFTAHQAGSLELSQSPGQSLSQASELAPGPGQDLGPPQDSLPEVGEPATAQSASAQSAWLGRQLSGPVRRGEVLTDASLLGNELLIGSLPGTQAVPLRVSDPATLTLLSQGQLVTVVLSRSEVMDGPVQNEIMASAVPVLWTPKLAESNSTLLPAQNVEGMVVVAASAQQALQLAGASTQGKVFLILVPQEGSRTATGSPD
nr:SAF domain-containing protein [Arthrobacter sp. BF1]